MGQQLTTGKGSTDGRADKGHPGSPSATTEVICSKMECVPFQSIPLSLTHFLGVLEGQVNPKKHFYITDIYPVLLPSPVLSCSYALSSLLWPVNPVELKYCCPHLIAEKTNT